MSYIDSNGTYTPHGFGSPFTGQQPATSPAPHKPTASTPPKNPVSAPNLPGLTSQQVNALSGSERNAYTAVYSTLKQYGLGSLASVLYSYEVQGYDSPTVNYLIQQTPQWMKRFAGNVQLEKAGLAPLDPQHYLETEQAYSQVLQASGIPKGMFGQDDFANWIGGSVSASEIQSRAQIASSWVNNQDPAELQALQQYHGITPGHMVAYALDQGKSLPFLNLVSQQAQIGAAAIHSGLSSSSDFSWQLANMVQGGDLSQKDVDTGYSQIAQTLPRMEDLAKLSGQSYNQGTAEQATFLGNASALQQQLHIQQAEQARFSGTPGLGTNFYHPAYGVGRDMEGAF